MDDVPRRYPAPSGLALGLDRPPVSELVRYGAGEPGVLQRGVEYWHGWVMGGHYETGPEARPVPWPEPAAVDDVETELFVSFGDVPHPDFVEVRVYGEETGPAGIPSAESPLQVVECRLSEPRRDKRIHRRGERVGVDLRLSPAPDGVRHLAAWASWDLPLLLQRRLGLPPGADELHAAWLFALRAVEEGQR